jgi:hypothetical protein
MGRPNPSQLDRQRRSIERTRCIWFPRWRRRSLRRRWRWSTLSPQTPTSRGGQSLGRRETTSRNSAATDRWYGDRLQHRRPASRFASTAPFRSSWVFLPTWRQWRRVEGDGFTRARLPAAIHAVYIVELQYSQAPRPRRRLIARESESRWVVWANILISDTRRV